MYYWLFVTFFSFWFKKINNLYAGLSRFLQQMRVAVWEKKLARNSEKLIGKRLKIVKIKKKLKTLIEVSNFILCLRKFEVKLSTYY